VAVNGGSKAGGERWQKAVAVINGRRQWKIDGGERWR